MNDFNLYSHLKSKQKTQYLQNMYMHLITTIACNLFKYDTPDFNQYFYEKSIMTGVSAFYKCYVNTSVNYKKWCCTPVNFVGVPDNSGETNKVLTYGSDYTVELEVNKDCILIYNNSSHCADMIFSKFADELAETDKSMSNLVIWSRLTPIPKVNKNSDVQKYETVLRNIMNGQLINVISDNTSLLTDKQNTHDDVVLKLTDENAISKMHFFSEYHEQLIRRLSLLAGMPFSSTAKSSQNLIDELHDTDLLSTIYISDRYETRKKCFKNCEDFSNFKFGFRYNENIEKQLSRISNDIERSVYNENDKTTD